MTRCPICGIIHLAFAGVAHLVERDLAKVEVASSSLVARSKKKTPSVRMVFSFWNAAGRTELAASTCAKRVKSRGKGRVPANGSAIRGMPGASRASSPAPKKKHHPLGWCFLFGKSLSKMNRTRIAKIRLQEGNNCDTLNKNSVRSEVVCCGFNSAKYSRNSVALLQGY